MRWLRGFLMRITSLLRRHRADEDFSQDAVTFHLSLDQHYGKPEQQADLFKQLVSRLEALPGVQAAGAVSYLPLSNSEGTLLFWVDGFPVDPMKALRME